MQEFAEFLVSLLDTPEKMQLLSDIRYTLHTHYSDVGRLSTIAHGNIGLFSLQLTWRLSMGLCPHMR